MRYINWRFTYLLTYLGYLFTYLHIYKQMRFVSAYIIAI